MCYDSVKETGRSVTGGGGAINKIEYHTEIASTPPYCLNTLF